MRNTGLHSPINTLLMIPCLQGEKLSTCTFCSTIHRGKKCNSFIDNSQYLLTSSKFPICNSSGFGDSVKCMSYDTQGYRVCLEQGTFTKCRMDSLCLKRGRAWKCYDCDLFLCIHCLSVMSDDSSECVVCLQRIITHLRWEEGTLFISFFRVLPSNPSW